MLFLASRDQRRTRERRDVVGTVRRRRGAFSGGLRRLVLIGIRLRDQYIPTVS